MRKLSLSIYQNLGIAIVLASAAVFLVMYVNTIERKQALLEAEEKLEQLQPE